MKNWLIVTTIIITFCQTSTGQRYRFLRSMEYERMMLTKDTSLQGKNEALEIQIGEFTKSPEIKQHQLPIVFHVLYKEGSKYPKPEQIENQLKELNKNFKLKGYKSKHPASEKEKFEEKEANVEIEFCLSLQDPSSKAVSGINYVKTWVDEFGLNNDMKTTESGGMLPWDVNKYINVWVVNLADSVSGFAQMPGRNPLTDGIVIDYDFIGSKKELLPPFDEGKTLVHLLGNYLGLYDLWGPCRCCDDGVDDTPIHNCPNFGKTDLYKHVSLCEGNPVEMSMNFMDNSDDEWIEMFTLGQKNRIQFTLSDFGTRSMLSKNDLTCAKNLAGLTNRSTQGPEIMIFPNPSNGVIEASITNFNGDEISIRILDISQRLVFEENIKNYKSKESITIDLSHLAQGVYNFIASDGKNELTNKLILY